MCAIGLVIVINGDDHGQITAKQLFLFGQAVLFDLSTLCDKVIITVGKDLQNMTKVFIPS